MDIFKPNFDLDINSASLSLEQASSRLGNRETTTTKKKAKTRGRNWLRSNQIEFNQIFLLKERLFYDLKVKYFLLKIMPTTG